MVRKCGVEGCLSDSSRVEDLGVTFHKVPMHTDIRPKWLSLCRISEEKKNCKVIHICSRHFLRADFCNFKGKKYMLRQGVLPSVFPWDKSKLEAIKAEIKKEYSSPSPPKTETKEKISSDAENKADVGNEVAKGVKIKEELEVKEEPPSELSVSNIKLESDISQESSLIEQESKCADTNYGRINFVIDSQIEALDFNNTWYPAKISEVDYEENEVLIHFENCSTKYDEWICMDSPRLRPLQESVDVKPEVAKTDIDDIIINRDSQEAVLKKAPPPCELYDVGERCLASWSNASKFPATVTKVLGKDTYEVIFDDGFVKNLKGHRMLKTLGKHVQSSPLFDPVKGTKEERREKKRKLDVAALFGKRPRMSDALEKQKQPLLPQPTEGKTPVKASGKTPQRANQKSNAKQRHPKSATKTLSVETSVQTASASVAPQAEKIGAASSPIPQRSKTKSWAPQWVNGIPVGVDSTIDTQDGSRKSIIVPDPRIPEGWAKHLTQRVHGVSAGKWDTVIVGPDNRRFRSKAEIKTYLDMNPSLNLSELLFDFSLHGQRQRRSLPQDGEKEKVGEKEKIGEKEKVVQPPPEVSTPPASVQVQEEQTPETNNTEMDKDAPNLKILHVDDSYKCPIEGCGKNFRKENLAQMHVKHYHPEYTKFLDSTPNVADLAYARTVGDSLDRSPVRTTPSRPTSKSLTPKAPSVSKVALPQSPMVEADIKPLSPQPQMSQPPVQPQTSKPKKDTEIIKLLNSKPYEPLKELQESQPSTQQSTQVVAPPVVHTDVKLRDLLTKKDSMSILDMDERVLKNMSTRPSGLKTLLPVRPLTEPEQHSSDSDQSKKVIHNKHSSKHGVKRKKISECLEVPRDQVVTPVPEVTEPPPEEAVPQPPVVPPTHIIEGGKVIKIVRMKQEEIINCTCGYAEEDGLMIQCELCLCWQHAYCNNIERESQVPEKYVCYICQNPSRQRSSRKYFHDQDWLKQGVLPTANFHAKDEEVLQKRFDKLKKSHDISGALVELKSFVNTLRVKLKIAEAKNHPKLYLWSKPWEKLPLPEKMDVKDEEEDKPKISNPESGDADVQNDPMLMMLLKPDKEENTLMDSNQAQAPIIPQPEAAIDSAVCRVNLLEHISHSQSLVEERLDDFEQRIAAMDDGTSIEEGHDYPRTRHTLQMLLRDLNTLQDFSTLSSI